MLRSRSAHETAGTHVGEGTATWGFSDFFCLHLPKYLPTVKKDIVKTICRKSERRIAVNFTSFDVLWRLSVQTTNSPSTPKPPTPVANRIHNTPRNFRPKSWIAVHSTSFGMLHGHLRRLPMFWQLVGRESAHHQELKERLNCSCDIVAKPTSVTRSLAALNDHEAHDYHLHE